MNFPLSLIVAMALFIMATGQFIPPNKTGAEFDVNPTAPDVQEAAAFAFRSTFPATTHTYSVKSGTLKIVAGMMYDLKVAVTEDRRGICTVINYVVWHLPDQRMTVPYELKKAVAISDSCF